MSDNTHLHGIVRQHIQECYRDLNHITCPWDGSEAKALDRMLQHNPSWTEMQWLEMISNYFLSEGVNGARPRRWLPNISTYARGPLNKFGRVKEEEHEHRFAGPSDIRKALSEDD
jgi:hypothetical protein